MVGLEPRGSASDDGVGEEEKLSGTRDEGELVGFALVGEASVESFELRVPVEGGGESGSEEAVAEALSSTGDVPLSVVVAGVVVVGSEAGESGGFLAGE